MNAVTVARKITDNVLILEEMKSTHGVYQDDHNSGASLRTTSCVGRYLEGEVESIVMLFENSIFCINPMYRDEDGAVHLSTCSIAGVVNARSSLEKGVAAFNLAAEESPWSKGKITEIIRFA